MVSERLGHKNVSMTMEIYAHVLPDMQEDAAATLGALLHPRERAVRTASMSNNFLAWERSQTQITVEYAKRNDEGICGAGVARSG